MSSLTSDYEIEYKQLKKQLKLVLGIDKAPKEHKNRLEKHLEELRGKSGLRSERAVEERLEYLKAEIESMKKKPGLSEQHALRCWYLRPLLSHLDHPGKIRALSDPSIGISALKTAVDLHIPREWGVPGLDSPELKRYFVFKSLGKSSDASKELTQKFLRHVRTTYEMPFSIPGITDLPLLSYNIDQFWTHTMSGSQDICIVSGICPISIITDELVFETMNGLQIRPGLGFEHLKPENVLGTERIRQVIFPKRPLLADYIELRRVFALAKVFADTFPEHKVRVKLWLPEYEYRLALTEEALSLLIEKDQIDIAQIKAGLARLSKLYMALVDVVYKEQDFGGEVKVEVTSETSLIDQSGELEVLLKMPMAEIVQNEIPRIYGLYRGSVLRKKLFALLAFKHLQPLLEDPNINVLHIENSYELWPSALAARWAEDWCARTLPECGELKQVFAFISTPSVPSPSLKYMRTLNAPHDHKFYLAVEPDELYGHHHHGKCKYWDLVSVLIPDLGANKKITNFRIELDSKLRQLTTHFDKIVS